MTIKEVKLKTPVNVRHKNGVSVLETVSADTFKRITALQIKQVDMGLMFYTDTETVFVPSSNVAYMVMDKQLDESSSAIKKTNRTNKAA